MAHHKHRRPKHRRSGCLLCKPQKLTANAKAARRRAQRDWADLERAAWDAEAAAIAAERLRSGAADHEDGAQVLAKLSIQLPEH